MAVKSDRWIREMCDKSHMITPYEPFQVRNLGDKKVISYGVSSFGYDMRIGRNFTLYTKTKQDLITKQTTFILHDVILDPKNMNPCIVHEIEADELIIPPHGFVLGYSVEKFSIPRNVTTIVLGKSTYARLGLVVNVTPLEPTWVGHVTIELSNTTNLPIKIYANEGIAQVLFLESDEDCEISYSDKNGKYQDQPAEVVLPRM